ncbi:EF-P beta-lysylation protein EpmB [Reinekea marina]|uniref:L-lysine 2,3-aminomutase n=1 Tax=Reinekea marina TaxID=1310421 RepID=A0ABV7WST6_9GAMM|nr:EF-P beta-lysylation protein EpmB [Reinekea marina]MDN3650394.1 EF-P beta-lysylation protein EpmB [Reinekea marina]
MIPVFEDTLQPNTLKATKIESDHWQVQLAGAFKSAPDLLTYLNIAPTEANLLLDDDATGFAFKVPLAFAQLMKKGDPSDPLLLQVITRSQELNTISGYSNDPLQEADYNPVPGLIHKYANRALLIAHQSCAVHCRYCFRRHFPYSEQQLKPAQLSAALNYIKQRPEINEIILSGGDPLSLSDAKLEQLINNLNNIETLTTIRIHTRTPVVLPDRICSELLETIERSNKKIVFVLHINHPNEIGKRLADKLTQLKNVGVTLLNQTVLLKEINDSADTLKNLSQKLWDTGVLPYYLHLLDPVQGAAHFNVSESDAIEIWQALQAGVSGYLLPRLVREIPNRPSKTWLNNSQEG